MEKNFKEYVFTDKIDYVKNKKPKECIFCKTAPIKDYIVFEDALFFVVINKYPYNPGHLMIIPKKHIENIEDLSESDALELFKLIKLTKQVLNKSHGPHGFNIGMNLGEAAGGSIKHIHVHVVPRYTSEFGYIEVTSGTRVIVEKLEDTHKKITSEFNKISN